MRRPVIDSGAAYKIVYLSKAPLGFTNEQLDRALEHHVRGMRKELQDQGKIVKKINKTLYGIMGDVRLEAIWEVLGEKRTKRWRERNASTSPTEQVSSDGRSATQAEGGQASGPL